MRSTEGKMSRRVKGRNKPGSRDFENGESGNGDGKKAQI